MENITVLRRIFIVFGISLLITGLLIHFYRSSFERFNENSKLLVHSLSVQEKIEELIGMIKDTESGTRGFIVTNDSAFLKPFFVARAGVDQQLDQLRVLFNQNPTQSAYLDSISQQIDKKIAVQDFIIHLKKSDNLKFGYLELMRESSAYMDTIRIFSAKMKAEQNRIRLLQDAEVSESNMYTRIISTIFSITAIAVMVTALISLLWEIRGKKKVKELLNTVLESAQSGIMSFKAVRDEYGKIIDFKFIQVNRIGAEMVKKKSQELIGKSLLETFPGNKEEGLFDEYIAVTEINTILKTEKYYKHDQIDLWFRIVAVKLEDGFTVTFDNISTEKRYESELQNYIFDLKRSNNELEQFAFVASHDLQEPLRKIQTFGERLKINSGYELSDNSIIYVDKMLSASKRMSNLINDLLSFSRLSRTKESISKVNLNEVLQDVQNDLELAIQNKQAVIKTGDLPYIEGVSSQLYQLFFNLIGNALKFSREGVQPEILIRAEKFIKYQEEDARKKKIPFVRITLSDNGIGFENQYAERIFEIFQRLHGKSEYDGTGIGLAICKRIVTNHRGNISAKGKPGEGADFVIELPQFHP